MAQSSVEGGCFCGAVRYKAGGRFLGSMVCHCRTCRGISGAPAVAWVSFPRGSFEFTQGEPRRFRSSARVWRTFCGDCGTPLTYEPEASPQEIDLTTCSLDEPNRFPPTHHSWLSHDLHWVKFGDGLPTYPRSRGDD